MRKLSMDTNPSNYERMIEAISSLPVDLDRKMEIASIFSLCLWDTKEAVFACKKDYMNPNDTGRFCPPRVTI